MKNFLVFDGLSLSLENFPKWHVFCCWNLQKGGNMKNDVANANEMEATEVIDFGVWINRGSDCDCDRDSDKGELISSGMGDEEGVFTF